MTPEPRVPARPGPMLPSLATVTWLVRATACVIIGLQTFVDSAATGDDLVLQVVTYAIGVAAIAYWLVTERRPAAARTSMVMVGLGVMSVAAGLSSTTPGGTALIGFCVIAVLAVGTHATGTTGWVIVGVTMLAVEISAVLSRTATATVLGYALILVVAFIGGRNRHIYLVQAEQSAAMLRQLEQLRAEQRQVAVLDERTRIAREIHDVLAHSLGALGIHIQVVRAVLADHGNVERALGLLEQAQRMANDGLVDTRRAVQALRGDTTRLDEQITSLIDIHRARHGTRIGIQIDGEPVTVTAEATVALVRTAQESLVNAAKHAPRQPVSVRLGYDVAQVRLTISNALPAGDTGREEARFSSVDGGFGLTGMRERLRLINGTLTAGADQHLWTVAAQVPQ